MSEDIKIDEIDTGKEILVDVEAEFDKETERVLSQDEELQVKLNVDIQKLLAHYTDNGFNTLRTATVLVQLAEMYQESILSTWKAHCKNRISD